MPNKAVRFTPPLQACAGRRFCRRTLPWALYVKGISVPRKFVLQPDEIEIPSVSYFREVWRNVPGPAARGAIAVENQYLHFHGVLLENLKHQKTLPNNAAHSVRPLCTRGRYQISDTHVRFNFRDSVASPFREKRLQTKRHPHFTNPCAPVLFHL